MRRCASATTAMASRPLREPGCYQIVLLRHGQSEWNHLKRFTGWVDVDLTDRGCREAAQAGRVLKQFGFEFDEAHTSVLKRAVRTLWTTLHASDHHWIPIRHTWRLNERHYGGLTGLSKAEAEAELGRDMLLRYRRGYDTKPLPMDESHPHWMGHDRRYRDLGSLLPRGESLKECQARILPYWYEVIVPAVRSGRNILIASHNNVIRCLAKHLDHIPAQNMRDLEIPTGVPLVYNLHKETLQPVGEPDKFGFRGRYLRLDEADEEEPPVDAGVSVRQVLTLELLQREAHRLNIDLSQIKCLIDRTDWSHLDPHQPVSTSLREGSSASSPGTATPSSDAEACASSPATASLSTKSEPEPPASAKRKTCLDERPNVAIGQGSGRTDPLDDWMPSSEWRLKS